MYYLLDTDQLEFIRQHRIKFALAADQAQEIIKQMYKDAQRYAESEKATESGINTLNFKLKTLVNYFNEAERLIQHLEAIFEDTAWSSGKNKEERNELYFNDLLNYIQDDINKAIQAGNTERIKHGWEAYQQVIKVKEMFLYMQVIPPDNIPYIFESDGIKYAQLSTVINYCKPVNKV